MILTALERSAAIAMIFRGYFVDGAVFLEFNHGEIAARIVGGVQILRVWTNARVADALSCRRNPVHERQTAGFTIDFTRVGVRPAVGRRGGSDKPKAVFPRRRRKIPGRRGLERETNVGNRARLCIKLADVDSFGARNPILLLLLRRVARRRSEINPVFLRVRAPYPDLRQKQRKYNG